MTAPHDHPPYPYMPVQQPPRKRHRVRNWLIIFSAALAAIITAAVVIAAAAGNAVNHAANPYHASPPAATAPAAAQPADTSAPAPDGPAMLSPGDTETIGDSSNTTEGTVAVDSVRVTTQAADPSFGSPPANGYYVIVHITAAADPAYTSGFDINALDFYALAPGGRQFSQMNGNAMEALSSAQESTDITATLGAGQSTSGWEAFDVSRPHGEIVYAPNYDGQPLAEWSY